MADNRFSVYVSYAGRDRKIVEPLVDHLRRIVALRIGEDVGFWMDTLLLRPGEDVRSQSNEIIQSAVVAVAFVTPAYSRSEWSLREAKSLVESHKPLFPIVFERLPVDRRELQFLLSDLVTFILPASILELHGFGERNGLFQALDRVGAAIAEQLKRVGYKSPTAPNGPAGMSAALVAPVVPAATAKGYVFLSYAEEDYKFVNELKEFLVEHQYGYWEFASSDRNYHTRIDLELEEAINRAAATVSILSPHWKSSDWALREFYYSTDVGKPVFLLRAKAMEPTLAIAGFPYIDFTKSENDAFAKLAREFQKAGL